MNTEHLYPTVGDVIQDGIARELPVRLTDLERLTLAEQKIAAEEELAAHRKRVAERQREIAAYQRALERRITDMGTQLREKHQRRVVSCYERLVDRQVELVRRDVDPRDPSSVIDRRAATVEESERVMTAAPTAPAKAAGRKRS